MNLKLHTHTHTQTPFLVVRLEDNIYIIIIIHLRPHHQHYHKFFWCTKKCKKKWLNSLIIIYIIIIIVLLVHAEFTHTVHQSAQQQFEWRHDNEKRFASTDVNAAVADIDVN